ncbi:OadG-related small transporter subunit [Enterococcus quebecensis]|uniref:Oxaloacetate decarboxylase, gamma chain family protein n=1 Tax=Enterococcus quebecensis TaxID=903983 RepID=A0A1E5H396_9ENTE|nr:OadG-related small transporter subunit [Enterococcus quebecensis]OEG19354.1 oxaloacetate decarboxylase, gamma chain family protein [Enterococcus quebecensis]
MNMEALKIAGELMIFGMGGVFLVLFLLFLISKLLLKIFPAK